MDSKSMEKLIKLESLSAEEANFYNIVHMNPEENDYKNKNFAMKLWMIINTKNDYVYWGHKGITIIINYPILDEYLLTTNSIFNTKTLSNFLHQLKLYGFREVIPLYLKPSSTASNPAAASSTVGKTKPITGLPSIKNQHSKFKLQNEIHEFKNEYFQRNKFNLLNCKKFADNLAKCKLKRYINAYRLQNLYQKCTVDTRYNGIVIHDTINGDGDDANYCNITSTNLTALQKSRITLKLTLELQNITGLLDRKLYECEQNKIPHIILPADIYEDPSQQISNLIKTNGQVTGYYDENLSIESINNFYEDYSQKFNGNNSAMIENNIENNQTIMDERTNDSNYCYDATYKIVNNEYFNTNEFSQMVDLHSNNTTTVQQQIYKDNHLDIKTTDGENHLSNNQFTAIHYESDHDVGMNEDIPMDNKNSFNDCNDNNSNSIIELSFINDNTTSGNAPVGSNNTHFINNLDMPDLNLEIPSQPTQPITADHDEYFTLKTESDNLYDHVRQSYDILYN